MATSLGFLFSNLVINVHHSRRRMADALMVAYGRTITIFVIAFQKRRARPNKGQYGQNNTGDEGTKER